MDSTPLDLFKRRIPDATSKRLQVENRPQTVRRQGCQPFHHRVPFRVWRQLLSTARFQIWDPRSICGLTANSQARNIHHRIPFCHPVTQEKEKAVAKGV